MRTPSLHSLFIQTYKELMEYLEYFSVAILKSVGFILFKNVFTIVLLMLSVYVYFR